MAGLYPSHTTHPGAARPWFFWFSRWRENVSLNPLSPASYYLNLHSESTRQNSCTPDIARGVLHFPIYSANCNFSLTASILFYIILLLFIVVIDFSSLTYCSRPIFFLFYRFKPLISCFYQTRGYLSFLRVLILSEWGHVKGTGILLEQKLKLPITSRMKHVYTSFLARC